MAKMTLAPGDLDAMNNAARAAYDLLKRRVGDNDAYVAVAAMQLVANIAMQRDDPDKTLGDLWKIATRLVKDFKAKRGA